MARRHKRHHKNAGGGLLKRLVMGTLCVAGGWIAYSAFGVDHDLPLPPAIDAERIDLDRNGLHLNVYADRTTPGRPLVLIHSINAAASAYEMRPLFEHYRAHRPVYALDLPGFGLSERTDRVYSPDLYKNAIIDLLSRVVAEPADVIALSLGSEFAALAALERPDLFHSLTMISPSGFTERRDKRASQKASDDGSSDTVYRVLSFPLWAQAFYDLLATRPGIRYFLKKSFEFSPDESLVEYDYLTTHQPDARFAPLYFVSGKLFTRDVRQRAYERLTMPALVLYDRDPYVRFDTLPQALEANPNLRAGRIMPTRGLPHFEQPSETFAALDSFWAELERVP